MKKTIILFSLMLLSFISNAKELDMSKLQDRSCTEYYDNGELKEIKKYEIYEYEKLKNKLFFGTEIGEISFEYKGIKMVLDKPYKIEIIRKKENISEEKTNETNTTTILLIIIPSKI